MKRFLSLLLSFISCLSLSLGTIASASYSGGSDRAELSQAEVAQLIESTEFEVPTDIWEAQPSTSGFVAGTLKTDMQLKLLARLNAWRTICGLSTVTLKDSYSEWAQYGALINAFYGDNLYHQPDQPSGMPADVFKLAYKGASSCNLSAGMALNEVVDGLISDKWARNLENVGHRRWFLNPAMSSTGFGFVVNSESKYKTFGAAYAFDKGQAISEYDYIAFPASGNFPNNTQAFTATTPWSVSVNPAVYGRLSQYSIAVTLTCWGDRRSWVFSSDKAYQPTETDDYFTVNSDSIGRGDTIIFRPTGVTTYDGLWEVSITLTSKTGSEVKEISYVTNFFNTRDVIAVCPPELEVGQIVYPAFVDVYDHYWAADYIYRAVLEGAVKGVDNSRFDPERSVTGYEFAAIILRGCFGEDLHETLFSPWYHDIDSIAARYRLWEGLDGLSKVEPLSRYDMAVMIYNVLRYAGVQTEVEDSGIFFDVETGLRGAAVSISSHYDILNGVSDGIFDGSSSVTRAQSAAVYCRLSDVLASI